MMAMLSVAEGRSKITETVFENRFMHVVELNRMGANITTEGRSAVITGPAHLTGCTVRATDLRAGAAMILAGACKPKGQRKSAIFTISTAATKKLQLN